MDKVQEIPPSTSYQTENSVLPQIFNSRISNLFHKSKTFEKKLCKRLDKSISLSIEIDTNSEKYKFIKASLARNILQSSDEDAYIESSGKRFIKRFEANYNRKQRSVDKLLSMIKTNEDLNKALQMIDNRFGSAEDTVKQIGIAKIKEVLSKTFNLLSYDERSSSTKQLVKPKKFIPTLPAILEEEESITHLNIHHTRL